MRHSPPLAANQQTHFSSSRRFFVLLVLLPLSLAAFAFALQWRGGVDDPVSRLHVDGRQFPGPRRRGSSSKVSASSDCAQVLGQSSRSAAFPYFRGWGFDFERDDAHLTPKVIRTICIISSTSAGLEQILPWVYYHKVIGVSAFFLFVEGKASSPHVSSVLESIAGVKVIQRTPELEKKQAKSRIWNETWLTPFFYKPCNYELFVKQSLNMEMAIVMAQDFGMDWIVHLDTDELLHPAGASEYSLRNLLSDVPSEVDVVVFSNYESCVEQDNLKDPFTEVSMFKKNYDHLPKELYFGSYTEVTRGNPNYFLTYGNGKSAARVQDHLRPNGAHRWHNYMKNPNETKLPEAAVLHYTYCKFSDLTSRRDRCNCKPTKEDVKRCFMLEFDRAAFIIASTVTEEEMLHWYREHVVWNDEKVKAKLLRKGVFTRIHTPMAIIQALKESGIFQAAISSAGKILKKESNNSNNRERIEKVVHYVVGNNTDTTIANTRKLLDIDEGSQEAIPPLSPPRLQ